MEPEIEVVGLSDSEKQALNVQEIKSLRKNIDKAIQEAGRIADFLSGDDGNETTGVHGLQMAYDRLVEAKMWAGKSLGEIGHKLPQEFRDEAK